MRKEVQWERMFPDELEQAFEACPLVYFTYGLCEPHGPQNTLGLDALKAHGIACRAALEYGGIVAPAHYWHIHELGVYGAWGHRSVGPVQRTWLTATPPWMFLKNICYHIRAADALGFHAAIFITGHYGPHLDDFKTLFALLQPHTGARLYGLPDCEANETGFYGDGGHNADHAGKVETSLLWAVEPSCVDVSRLPGKEEVGPHLAMGKDAFESNRKTGQRMLADQVAWLGRKTRELLDSYEKTKPTQRLRTFAQVEQIWKDIVRPRFTGFKSMDPVRDETAAIPENSAWKANAQVPGDDQFA